jgi:hypothetical protein
MDDILLVWKDSFVVPNGKELRQRILSFFHLDNEKEFKDFVKGQDEKKMQELCSGDLTDCFKEFLDKGDVRNAKDVVDKSEEKDLRNLLTIAAVKGSLEMVKYITGKGVLAGNTALQGSAEAGHLEIFKYLVDNEDVRIKKPKSTILMNSFQLVTKNGNMEMVKYFVDNRAGPLDYGLVGAILGDQLEVAKYIVEHEGDEGQLEWSIKDALRQTRFDKFKNETRAYLESLI